MKKILTLLLLLLIAAGGFISAQEDAVVVYIDGWVDIKNNSGSLVEAWEGDPVYVGESVITDPSGYAELEQGTNAALIKISPDTVFTLGEIDEGGEKRTVLSTSLGSVAYKFNKTVGREPYISTPSMVAGVRGTEFTVFAGVDGSTLVAVESGQVDVTAEGETVELYPEEGVEVQAGETPGEKFEVLRGKVDYSSWNRERFEAFLADPAAAVKRVKARLETYIEEIDAIQPEYEKLRRKVDENRETYRELKEKDEEEATKYYADNVESMVLLSGRMFRNLRYYSLSALSMRRFVLGRLYMEMKSRYIMDLQNPVYLDFIELYEQSKMLFEDRVVPLLVEADI